MIIDAPHRNKVEVFEFGEGEPVVLVPPVEMILDPQFESQRLEFFSDVNTDKIALTL